MEYSLCRLPPAVSEPPKKRGRPRKEAGGVSTTMTSLIPATRYKWPSAPQHILQTVKADYLVRCTLNKYDYPFRKKNVHKTNDPYTGFPASGKSGKILFFWKIWESWNFVESQGKSGYFALTELNQISTLIQMRLFLTPDVCQDFFGSLRSAF